MSAHLSREAILQNRLLMALTALTVAKILSTAALVVQGNYRTERTARARRLASITSKVTPVLMCLTAGLLEMARGERMLGWILIAATPLVAGFAALILHLRSGGRFYGGADWLERFLTPQQARRAILAFLGVLLIFALRVL